MPAEYISSESNPRIKLIKALRDRKKIRYAERLFVVEGPRFVEDALIFASPVLVTVSEAWEQAHGEPDFGVPTIIVPDALFAHISDTQHPQGILGLFPLPELEPDPSIAELVVVADGVQDPGNLGTLIRSSAALGATRVLCVHGTVDPWSPKVTRAAAAAMFQIPVRTGVELERELEGLAVFAADGSASKAASEVDWTSPCAVIVGSEGAGIVSDIRELNPIPIAIPFARPVESLNAGVAASILLYEANRQRLG